MENYSETEAEFDCQDLPSRLFVIKTRFPNSSDKAGSASDLMLCFKFSVYAIVYT